jgi:bifunctional ADP-heptose synthase (sugar kinase/adenylyltransferase)
MAEKDRVKIVEALNGVDEVVLSIDEDRTVCRTLAMVNPDIFANGGDRHNKEIPEAKICREQDIQLIDGLGGKIRSSSDLTGLKEK